ncbi:hypothetical protein WDU94_009497 [Cyamophila willieti]
MCEELKLKKLESEAWGFRLTGGRDFGTPLTVLRVTGASVAEESGMEVGDMIVTINGKCAQSMTHVEAQQQIMGAGNSLVLQILRGSPVPAPELTTTPSRGMTPNILHQRCESELTNDSHEHKLIESSFAHLHQFSNENEPSEEELQEQQIAEKMLENAELLEGNVIGVNFKRFIPKVDFIKNSLVYQVLQEEQVFKAKTEEEQLEKCPEKRFSTFLVHPTNLKPKVRKELAKLPKRPKTPLEPEVKEKSEENKIEISGEKNIEKSEGQSKLESKPIASEEPKPTATEERSQTEGEVKKLSEGSKVEHNEKVEEKAPSIDIQINDEIIQPATEEKGDGQTDKSETNEVVDEILKPSQESGSTTVSVDALGAPLTTKQEILNAQQELPAIEEVQEETEEHPTEDSEFNKQLVLIKSQLENLRQLPSLIETQLNLFQNQIDSLVDLKNKEAKPNQPDPSDSTVQEPEKSAPTEAIDSTTNDNSENHESGVEIKRTTEEPRVEQNSSDQLKPEETSVQYQGEVGDLQGHKEDGQLQGNEIDKHDPSETPRCQTPGKTRPKKSSLFNGITPQPRPVVLPGGRIWRKPQDAYIDEFIAETLVNQAEVLIGTQMGVNFRKYEPPKFSMSESAVWRLINNIENKSSEIEPANDFYQTPIDEKKIFVAGLQMNPDVESVVREVEESEALKNAPPVNNHHIEVILDQEPVSSF